VTPARALLADTRRRPGRLLLTGLAVAVATLFAADTVMLGDTLRTFLATAGQLTPAATATPLLAALVVGVTLVAALAAALPAVRAGRTSPLAALRS
jgi:ABC-type antimicrobial peptide transport system permease subunit